MKLIDLIAEGKFAEAREEIYSLLNTVAQKRLQEAKRIIAVDIYEEMEELNEANIVRQGRIQKIRRRIRRNAKGRIIVQRNVRRSAIKGFRISGNTVKRIPAMARINKARKLKRYWKTKGRAKLGRTLLKRKMSMRRRQSMGIK
jgi:PHD/YefM family antitoxin component YafN of YafNO toxin-antitoxin module